MQSQENYFSSGYNHSNWLPGFGLSDLWYRTFAFNASINLKKLFGIIPEISFGFGCSRIFLNLGEYTVTVNDPISLYTFNAYEKSEQYTVGVGINYWVKASGGITRKHILSNTQVIRVQGQWEEPVQLLPNISPFLDFNIGRAKNNLGDKKVIYNDDDQIYFLPRYARVGIGFDLGIVYNKEEVEWQPLAFKWTIEANDVLVHRFPPWKYQYGL